MEKKITDKELRILILEDIVTDVELMEHELRKAGITFTSRCVQKKEAFLKELEDFAPNLILADYSLPQFNGISALAIAKEQCPDVPFIIVSGVIGEELAVEAIKSGATDYVFKQRLFRLVPSVRRALREAEKRAELKQAEEALRESEEKYRSLVESTEDSIFLLDRNYRYLFMNKKYLSRLNLSRDNYQGRAYSEFHPPEETKELIEKATGVFETGESVRIEYRSHRDGKYFLRTLSPIKGQDGKVLAITIVSKDITELKQTEEKLQVMSLTDELTGLYNRRGFFTLSEQQLKMTGRLKSGIFMLYADLDNLKEINDRFGHQGGDLALIEIADIFKTTYRASDIIARIGGDEFTIFSVGNTRAYAEIMTARLQNNLDILNAKTDRNYKLSISVGITYCDSKCPYSIDDLLAQAERLMYEQKRRKQKS